MNKTLYIFDLDDTLVKTDIKVRTYNDDGTVTEYTPSEWNNANIDKTKVKCDFSEFNNLKPFAFAKYLPAFEILNSLYKLGIDVAIITSRGDSTVIHQWLKIYGNITIPDEMVYAINHPNSDFSITDAVKKKEALKYYHKEYGFNHFIVFDDNEEFLNEMKKAEVECEGITSVITHKC